jgi:hypothetical protein
MFPEDPHRDVDRFQGRLHDAGQVVTDRVQVDRVLEPGRERGHGLVGVIAGPVEPQVQPPLHRRRTGLNRAAAARVAAATATGVCKLST